MTITFPLPPQLVHIALLAVRPLPLQTGQGFSPVCSVPGAASSPGLRMAADGSGGEEGLLIGIPSRPEWRSAIERCGDHAASVCHDNCCLMSGRTRGSVHWRSCALNVLPSSCTRFLPCKWNNGLVIRHYDVSPVNALKTRHACSSLQMADCIRQ